MLESLPGFPSASQTYKTGAMKRRISEIAKAIGARVVGDGGIEVSKVASIPAAVGGDLVFIEDEKNLDSALHSKASAVIASDFAEGRGTSKVLLIASHPRLAFALAGEFLRKRAEHQPGVHPNAFVHSSAKLGTDVSIDANATVHGEAEIVHHTGIGAGTEIDEGTDI